MTEVDEHGICHIDGPPYAGFAIAEHSDGTGQRVEIIYKMLRYIGSEQDCRDACQALLNLVISELQDLEEVAFDNRHLRKIIWWRRRPEFIHDPDSGRWCFSCRFDTTPKLPDTFWERWMVAEGMPGRNAKEVIG
jgi:hypothetical protein